jgi:hypothetical protein
MDWITLKATEKVYDKCSATCGKIRWMKTLINVMGTTFPASSVVTPIRWSTLCAIRYMRTAWQLNNFDLLKTLNTYIIFQLSCDLNPNPVTEGHGFDYSEIARRAAANMALAKQ